MERKRYLRAARLKKSAPRLCREGLPSRLAFGLHSLLRNDAKKLKRQNKAHLGDRLAPAVPVATQRVEVSFGERGKRNVLTPFIL